ncbi:MAG: HNH endonuclease [Micrococcaceae bacterium]|nr:HNH endonuclease [Micrococcaceae bacterium]
MTIATAPNLLETLDLPGVDGPVDWGELTTEQLHDLIRGAFQQLDDQEPDVPSDGVLQRSMQLEETLRAATPLQYLYTGLIKDGFDTVKLRDTLGLPRGKTAFRDTNDLIAKTHGIRGHEAAGRVRLAASMTPARVTDPDRGTTVGETRLPILGAFQGRVNPGKLSAAVSMINDVDKTAETAGKDEAYRAKLRTVIEKDLATKIESTTPEEFSRFVGERKRQAMASLDPADHNFSQQQTDAMYDVRRVGPVRGNKNAIEYKVIMDAEGDEATQTMLYALTNPRGKDDDAEFETRSKGHRRMHALRDLIKFGMANLDKSGFRGASGAHTQMLVITDYATLLDGVRKELAGLLPEIDAEQRERLLTLLAQMHTAEVSQGESTHVPEIAGAQVSESSTTNVGESVMSLPPPKTTDIGELFDDDNLDRLQPRVSQGIFTRYIPPDVIFRLRCDVGVSPITLTGRRQVLSSGQQQRQFSEPIRRAILARDRGCVVPGCYWAASLCEVHHVQYWSEDGDTSTANGVQLCSHHHQALHADQLHISKVDGEFRFTLHRLIDPGQEPRKNYFFQT